VPRDGSGTIALVHRDRDAPTRLWQAWRRAVQQRRLAAQISDRDLADLGLTRGDLYRELRNSPRFWHMLR